MNALTPARRRRGSLTTCLVTLAAAAVVACGPSSAAGHPAATLTAAPTHGRSALARSAAPTHSQTAVTGTGAPRSCQAHVLRGRGGRQGESMIAHGDIDITNTGRQPCLLHGMPRVEILRSDGSALGVRQARPIGRARPLVLPPGRRVAALTVSWANWCHGSPGPLLLRITLPGAAGALVVPFDGPPDYNYVPRCTSPGHASTIAVLSPYGA